MTGKKEDGGPAFPSKRIAYHKVSYRGNVAQGSEPVYEDAPGMTLRDYYAAHAPAVSDEQVREDVEGFPTFDNSGYHNGFPHETIRAEQRAKQVAWMREARIKWRWQYADAMIAERAK